MRTWASSGLLAAATAALVSPPPAFAGVIPGIGAGSGHSCVNTGGGGLYCWGRNDVGQLGDGTTTERHRPVGIVDGGILHHSLAVQGRNTCVTVQFTEVVECTGSNQYGQIGDGTTVDRHVLTPIANPALTALTTYSAGDTPCAALTQTTSDGGVFTSTGGVYCWGSNQFGSVGDATTSDRSVPVLVLAGGFEAQTSGGGGHACGFTGTQAPFTLWCWGNNVDDALGLGQGAPPVVTSPVQITVPGGGVRNNLLALAVGVDHDCVIDVSGGLWCWGNNDHGQLGDGTTNSRSTPVQVTGVPGPTGVWVSPSGGFSCATASGGDAYCWGRNDRGQLGNGTTTEQHAPVRVTGMTGPAGILAAGDDHVCAYFFTGSSRVACWGGNEYGQVGDGTTTDRLTPAYISLQPQPSVPASGRGGVVALALVLLLAGALAIGVRRRRFGRV